jgi:hypothetical protein
MAASGRLHTRLHFRRGMIPWYPLEGRLGGHQSWIGHCEEEKNPCPLQIKPTYPSHPAHNLGITLAKPNSEHQSMCTIPRLSETAYVVALLLVAQLTGQTLHMVFETYTRTLEYMATSYR